MLLDRLLIQARWSDLDSAIIFTKIDLLADQRGKDGLDLRMPEVYQRIGYPSLLVSNMSGESREAAEEMFRGRISVLAGPSGAGKTSLLNMLDGELNLKTASVSEKIGRGRHTTRHVELLPVAGGLVADTPGFSALYLPKMDNEELQFGFPEMVSFRDKCRFSSCLHEQEPDCAVRDAMEEGLIDGERYDHYLYFLTEIRAQNKRY
jgi:ribosome biogenesis GTPase